jgi:hypothetical protein
VSRLSVRSRPDGILIELPWVDGFQRARPAAFLLPHDAAAFLRDALMAALHQAGDDGRPGTDGHAGD